MFIELVSFAAGGRVPLEIVAEAVDSIRDTARYGTVSHTFLRDIQCCDELKYSFKQCWGSLIFVSDPQIRNAELQFRGAEN
jgi:hypothetical protein